MKDTSQEAVIVPNDVVIGLTNQLQQTRLSLITSSEMSMKSIKVLRKLDLNLLFELVIHNPVESFP